MTKITQALIMAAGHATRMRPLTDNMPKPLLIVADLPLLTHIINHLIAENVTKIIINGYHAIDELIKYIDEVSNTYPNCEIILSREDELLETGGGAVKALQYIDVNNPIYMINGDAFWVNAGNKSTLGSLSSKWNKIDADCLLLLQPINDTALNEDVGDYLIENDHAVRSLDKNGTHMFTGVRILNPKILTKHTVEKFSYLKIMDECEKDNRLYAHTHDGKWYHISTPNDLNDLNSLLNKASIAS